jgi:dihydropteroate synthase
MGNPSLDISLPDGVLECGSRTLIMGILNVTPDSFSDGGRFFDRDAAVEQGLRLAEQGADIIDVGGESTRPGSDPVPPEEELRRVIPVIEALSREIQVPISIDTQKAGVAARAIEAGASIVNDISALRADPQMASVVAQSGVAVVLMHMKGTPKDMQLNPVYDDLMGEIVGFLRERIEFAQRNGIPQDKIIIDPGIGFGKTVEHNLQIIRDLNTLRALGRPIMLGTSRKSFIGRILNVGVDEREEGTAATVALGIWNGANLVRVHNVAKMKEVVRMVDAILRV